MKCVTLHILTNFIASVYCPIEGESIFYCFFTVINLHIFPKFFQHFYLTFVTF